MQIADRVIVRKIKAYDPYLFVSWNNQKGYFELWREMAHGRRLITPITAQLHDPALGKTYAPLDERLLWWIAEADSWKVDHFRRKLLEEDTRWAEWEKKQRESQKRDFYDRAKDAWHATHNFFATRPASKNEGKPTFNKVRPYNRWISPDVSARTSSRLFSRSRANALAYGFKR